MTATLYADPLALWERLLKRVTISETGCWRFTGAVTSRGYGCVGAGRKGHTVMSRTMTASRCVRKGHPLTVRNDGTRRQCLTCRRDYATALRAAVKAA